MSEANKDIRQAVTVSGFFLWQIADRYGVTDVTFSKKLRKELPEEEKKKIFNIIEELKRERGS